MGNKSNKERLTGLTQPQAERYAKLLNTSVDKIRAFELQYISCDEASKGKITKETFCAHFNSYFATKNDQQSNEFIAQLFDVFDINKDGLMSFEEFLAGNVFLTGEDKKKSLEIMFSILDIDKDGYVSQKELETICIATRGIFEGDNCWSSERNTFEKKGQDDAARLMTKLDDQNQGRITKEKLISHLMTDPDLKALQKRFNLNSNFRPVLSDGIGTKPMSLGDLIK